MLATGMSPAFAQDVVMRRPLPTTSANPQGCELTGTCTGTPTPTQTCTADGTCTPTPTPPGTPTPTPTQSCDSSGNCTPTPTPPGTPTPTPVQTCIDPDSCFTKEPPPPTGPTGGDGGTYAWVPGPWSGTATCGQSATITRTMDCQELVPNFGGGTLGMNDIGADDGTRLASYEAGAKAYLSSGVYDPAASDVRMHLAQFGDYDTNEYKITSVDPSQCEAALGDPPPDSYTGTKAGCGYHPEQTATSDWQDDGGGIVGCSASAYRSVSYKCLDSQGDLVDNSYCVNDLESGGTQNYSMTDVQYGNYSGCTYGWVGIASDDFCFSPQSIADGTWVRGKDHWADFTYQCERSDGQVETGVDEASCAADDRPFDGPQIVGTCHNNYYFGYTGQACIYDHGENVTILAVVDPKDIYNGSKLSQMCVDSGATSCCSLRQVDNEWYASEPEGTYELIGGTMGYTQVSGWYFDNPDQDLDPNDPNNIHEGPYFYDMGGYQSYEPDSFNVQNDDRRPTPHS